MVKFVNVSQNYGNFIALHDLNFEIKESSLLALLGPNGAGKSTTMSIMTGFRPPLDGEVYINGINIFEDPLEAKKYIGYLSETPPLYPELTVLEYLHFVAGLRGVEKRQIDNRIKEVLELLALTNRENALIKNLSKGLKQRVGIAQSILHKPKLLVLDEPTVGLEPAQLIDFRNIIRYLVKETGMTVVISTHIMSEASELCDHVIIINEGKKIFDGTQEDLLAEHKEKNTYEMILNEIPDNIQDILSSIEGIEKTYIQDNKIYVDNRLSNVNKIIEKILLESLELRSISPKVSNLEKVFLDLTQENK